MLGLYICPELREAMVPCSRTAIRACTLRATADQVLQERRESRQHHEFPQSKMLSEKKRRHDTDLDDW
jgi:hypothetical protein